MGGFYLDYRVSSGPFLRFSMRFAFLSEMFDHLVCETRDPSLTIFHLTHQKRSEAKVDLGGHFKNMSK